MEISDFCNGEQCSNRGILCAFRMIQTFQGKIFTVRRAMYRLNVVLLFNVTTTEIFKAAD